VKVLPEVQFEFAFQLKNSQVLPALTAANKLDLFQQILLDLGVGAKTNVGYGQFESIEH
jgi:CRISPR-associated protein Cmr6